MLPAFASLPPDASSLLRPPGGSSSLPALLQLQSEVERLQLAVAAADSRRRVAEQRAQDAEVTAEDLQTKLAAARQAHRQAAASLDAPDAARLKLKVGLY